ncbi:MAG TPA: hypothetical protein VGG44_05345, partial [Tepidisphaeraceae bacterium]
PEVKALLSGQLGGIAQQLGGEFSKQVTGLAGSLENQAQGKVGDLINSTGQNAVQQLLGGGKNNKK